MFTVPCIVLFFLVLCVNLILKRLLEWMILMIYSAKYANKLKINDCMHIMNYHCLYQKFSFYVELDAHGASVSYHTIKNKRTSQSMATHQILKYLNQMLTTHFSTPSSSFCSTYQKSILNSVR